ncbi:MAG: hypothetical protein PHW37_05615 [Acholeplasmataceae bacterium]|jgi:hypothetical protein|nr:hypothetical protein [Acholeplasmataceae bacterium]
MDIDENNHLGSIVFPNEIKASIELVEILNYQFSKKHINSDTN